MTDWQSRLIAFWNFFEAHEPIAPSTDDFKIHGLTSFLWAQKKRPGFLLGALHAVTGFLSKDRALRQAARTDRSSNRNRPVPSLSPASAFLVPRQRVPQTGNR